MHRHLTSCVARVARGGPRALEDALLVKGIRTLRDANGARFEFVDKSMAATAPEPAARQSAKSQRASVPALAPAPPPPLLHLPPPPKAPSPRAPQREFSEDSYDDLDAELDARRMSLDTPSRPTHAHALSAMDVLASASAVAPRMPVHQQPASDAMETS